MNKNLELKGAMKRLVEGHNDFYYGGGGPSWDSKTQAYEGIPKGVRKNKIFAVIEEGKYVQYIWNDPTRIEDGDEVPLLSFDLSKFLSIEPSNNTTFPSSYILDLMSRKLDRPDLNPGTYLIESDTEGNITFKDSTGIFKYRGQKNDLSELPQVGNSLGDVYEILDNQGMYVAWNGITWDVINPGTGPQVLISGSLVDNTDPTHIKINYNWGSNRW